MKLKVYVETSVFSFLTARKTTNLLAAAWQNITIDWWDTRKGDFELYISELVYEEGLRGDPDAAARRIKEMEGLPYLNITDEAINLAKKLMLSGLLPSKASDDALHLAISTLHKMDFLLTWNCRHLDNAEIKPKIRLLLNELGYAMPEICTPQELSGE
ncbi:MAG: hypothetical protein GF398_13325 [Chitinivibrionales bacterium]|nr:hypothetical protein [Chitinivibrionales bacterium]